MPNYTPLITVNQTDNGKTLHLEDATIWSNPSNTGVTNVKIELTVGTTKVTMVNAAPSGVTQADLIYDLTSLVYSGSDTPFADGEVTITYTLTATPILVDVGVFPQYLDYNSKLYVLTLQKDVPYNLGEHIVYNKNVEYAALTDVIYKGMIYSAATGQVQKADDLLEILQNLETDNS